MRTSNAFALAVALGCALAAGCGGKKGTLSVQIVVPVNADPFAQAARVHIWAGDPPIAETTATVTAGKFDAQLQFKPPSSAGVAGAEVSESTVTRAEAASGLRMARRLGRVLVEGAHRYRLIGSHTVILRPADSGAGAVNPSRPAAAPRRSLGSSAQARPPGS